MLRRLLDYFRPAPPGAAAVQGHMTFGDTAAGRTLTRTRLFLKKQLWVWPIVAIVVLGVVGYGVRLAIQHTIEDNLRSQLQTLLHVETAMLEKWLAVQEAHAESLANERHVRDAVEQILAASAPSPAEGAAGQAESSAGAAAPVAAPEAQAALARVLEPRMATYKYAGFVVADKQQRIIAASQTDLIGQTLPEYEGFLTRALDGQTTVSPPFPSVVSMKDDAGRMRTGVPTMFVSAPVRDASFQVIGALALRIRPEREFTQILQLGRIGETGETYALDKTGRLVSNSRFDEELILLGLLPDQEDSRSILNISLRDPGGNMEEGFRPGVRRSELPLTKMAAAATAGQSGVSVAGDRDYRGVPVVSAWTWLPKYDVGVVTKLDFAEAFRPLTILRWAFFSLFALLVISSVAIFAFTVVVARLQREAQKAAIEAKQLGQYHLEAQIGSGAMGVVYRGHHAMLRRPTAIKMLNVDRVNEGSIQRFEREVQITCQLNNPHTVAIYDYGRTPEGVFYYAMEYLDGIDLQALVDRYGPQPEGRVVGILMQVCASLHEAHALGLVHRDIKPANIMLNRRGGEPDVVKVLDFGLVKARDDEKQARQSGGALSGTPLYMSPEAIQTPDMVDARSDLYAVGAVGYFLLTGQPVFRAHSLVELCQQHVVSVPETPSQRLGRSVSAELEHALLACLEKNRAKRPQTARDLAAMLTRTPASHRWTLDEAEAWWSRHERSHASGANPRGAAEGTGLTSRPSEAARPADNTAGFEHTIVLHASDDTAR